MSHDVMRGATRVRQFISTHLANTMPPLLVVAREQWGKEVWEMPDPVEYDSYDPLTMKVYPSIGAVVTRTRDWARIDINDHAEEVYNAVYSVQTFLWVISPAKMDGSVPENPRDRALLLRDDMLAVMRSCFLGMPSLGAQGLLRLNEKSMSEDYLDAMKVGDQNPKWLAGGTIAFDVQVNEQNYLAPIGVVNTTSVETAILPTSDGVN